jgi:hypothetical protein
LPGHTRSRVGCFLSYDYHIDWMYFVLYVICPKLVRWLSAEPYHRAILSPIYSTPIYPTLRRRVLSLHDGAKLRKGADQLELQGSSGRRPCASGSAGSGERQCAGASTALAALRRLRVLRAGGRAATGVLRGLPGPFFTAGSGVVT